MEQVVRYLETGSVNPYYNLAFEEYVLTHRTEGDYLMLWQNNNTIVVGQNQNTEAEINRAFVEAHHINVVRRSTGGGAVYHDLGNLNYSFFTDVGEMQDLAMQRFTAPVVEALRSLGLQCEASGRNDILVEGHKVSGTAQRVAGNRILHHGTLLFNSDSSAVVGALKVDPAKFQGKSVQSVRGRIGNIRDYLRQDMDLPAFWAYLKQYFAGESVTMDTMTAAELLQIRQLRDSKYATWEWNFGHSPQFSMTNKKHFAGGSLEACLLVKDGLIQDAVFYGDFLSRKPLDAVKQALIGRRFEQSAVCEALSPLALSDYFGAITLNEVLETLF